MDAIEGFAKKVKSENPLEAFEQALENAKPTLEVKSRRIGGATYQVPVEIPADRRNSLAMRWIILHSHEPRRPFYGKGLPEELADCYNNQGTPLRKKTIHTAWLKRIKLLLTTNGKRREQHGKTRERPFR